MKKLIIFVTLVIAVVFNSFAIEAKDTANTVTIKGIVKNTYNYLKVNYLKVLNIEDSLIVDSKIEDNRFEVVGIPKGTYRLVFAHYIGGYSDTIITINTDCCFDTLRVSNYYDNISDHYIWQRQCRMKTPDYSDFCREIYIDYRKSVVELNKTLEKQICNLSESECYDAFDSIENVDTMLNHLKGVSLKPGYVLDVFYISNWGGGTAYYYCRRPGESKLAKNPPLEQFENVLDYMIVEFTPEGIWSAFQLEVSNRYLYKFGCGYYSESWLVFSVKDEIISSFYVGRNKTARELKSKLDQLLPIKNRVEITSCSTAELTAYFWNDWLGLVEEKVQVQREGSSVKFIFTQEEHDSKDMTGNVLAPYHCGVIFE